MNRRDHRQQKQTNLSEDIQEQERLKAFVSWCEASVAACREHLDSPEAKARLKALLAAAQHSHWKVEKPYENWRRAGFAGYYYVQAAFPDLTPALIRLRNAEKSDIPPLIDYLEADPFFFRSGFLATQCIVHLKRAELTTEQEDRIRKLVLMIVDKRDRREFRHYCRLARRVYSPELESVLIERMTSPDGDIARRARWMLNACR